MAEEPFTVQKGPQRYALLEKAEVKPAPRVCRGSRDGMVCLSRRPQQSVLTEVHAAQWVVSQRIEHLPVMHEWWWEEKLGYGLGYANGRWTGQASQMYFFGRHLCRLGAARLPSGIVQVAAGAEGWHIVAQDENVYAYGWEGQPRWQWRMPPRVARRGEGLIQFAMGAWRRSPLIAAQEGAVGVSGGAQLRCLDAWGTELWRQALPRRAHPMVDLTEEMLQARVGTMRAQAGQPPARMDEVGYFCWEWDTRQEEPAWERRMWVREDRQEGDEDGSDDVEVATALAANRQAVYVGTCEGELLAWSWQGSPQMRLRLAEGPVGSLCVDASGLRAAQSGDTVIYFREGSIRGKSRHGDQRPSMAALEEELVLWTRYESWTVDARGVVRWAARWEKPIVTCVPAAGGFAVVAGSGLYRFGGGGEVRVAPHAVAGQVLGGAELCDPAESPAKSSPPTRRAEAGEQAEKAKVGNQRARLGAERLPAKVGTHPTTTSPRNKPAHPVRRRTKPAEAARDGSQVVEGAPVERAMSKKAQILELVQRPGGATLQELREATGWQAHSVRGFLSGVLGKQMGLTIISTDGPDGRRRYAVAR